MRLRLGQIALALAAVSIALLVGRGIWQGDLARHLAYAAAMFGVAMLLLRYVRRQRALEEPLISIVLLLMQPRQLNSAMLRKIAAQALGVEFAGENDNDKESAPFLVGREPAFIMRMNGSFFLINSFSFHYAADPEKEGAKITELRLRKAMTDHRAWLSVDLLRLDENAAEDAAYRVIGKLISALAGKDTLAVYAPQTSRLVPYDDELKAKLAGDNPLTDLAFVPVPVTEVADSDPDMAAAVAEARRRWPEFIAAFNNRKPGQNFAAKRAFSDGRNTEYMWISVERVEHDVAYGVVNNDPVNLRGVRCGDDAEVRLEELNDWMYADGDEMVGGFTVNVVMAKTRSGSA